MPIREEITRDNPSSSPRIDHERAPTERPRHSPPPSPKSSHASSRNPLKPKLQRSTDTHENEEPAGSTTLDPMPEPPYPEVMQDARHNERSYARARFPQQCAAGTRTVHDEHVSEELMPSEAPEFRDRRGRPRAIGERRPSPVRLPQDDPTDQSRKVVHRINGRGNHQATAQAEKCCPSAARDRAQGGVEQRVACEFVQGGMEVL